MRIIDYNSVPSYAGQTKTMRTFGAWLGEKPANLSKAVLLKPHYTANMLLDGLMNVYEKDNTAKEWEPIPAMNFQWQVDTSRLVRIKFAENCTDDGQGKRDVRVILDRKYYDKGDTFRLRNGQMLFVRFQPKRLAENRWEHIITLVTNNLNSRINVKFMTKGSESMYISNYFPELSERGFSKWTFNAEKHMNYISRHRHSDSISGDYAAMQNYYVATGKNTAKNAEVLLMPDADKRLTEQFMQSRNGNLLWGVCNFDANGKCLDKEEDGRDIPMGDGIITQFARYCDKFTYNDGNLSIGDLDEILYAVTDKTGKSTDHTIAFLINRRLWRAINRTLTEAARGWVTNGSEGQFINKNGKYLRFGNAFNSYTNGGNTINFMVDECLTEMYPDRGYGICVDASLNDKGIPNISLITLKGRGIISGTLLGMGGVNGNTSGNIASSVDGTEFHILGYGGCAVYNPYAGAIITESIGF